MSLHGLSHDAWGRYSGGRSWDYRILAPGFKYNLTDVAAAIGIHQLARAEEMRVEREGVARRYRESLRGDRGGRASAATRRPDPRWHLFPIRLRLERLAIDRNAFMDELQEAGVGCSVHWRPAPPPPYYDGDVRLEARRTFPSRRRVWERLVSLPIFPGMRDARDRSRRARPSPDSAPSRPPARPRPRERLRRDRADASPPRPGRSRSRVCPRAVDVALALVGLVVCPRRSSRSPRLATALSSRGPLLLPAEAGRSERHALRALQAPHDAGRRFRIRW